MKKNACINILRDLLEPFHAFLEKEGFIFRGPSPKPFFDALASGEFIRLPLNTHPVPPCPESGRNGTRRRPPLSRNEHADIYRKNWATVHLSPEAFTVLKSRSFTKLYPRFSYSHFIADVIAGNWERVKRDQMKEGNV